MGDWHVLAGILPKTLQKGVVNLIERYIWDSEFKRVLITSEHTRASQGGSKGSVTAVGSHSVLDAVSGSDIAEAKSRIVDMKMMGEITNEPINSQWKLHPKFLLYLPLGISYLILHVADDYSYAVVGVPCRSYLWIITRKRPINTDKYNSIQRDAISYGSKSSCKYSEDKAYLSFDEEMRVMEVSESCAVDLGYRRELIRRVLWE